MTELVRWQGLRELEQLLVALPRESQRRGALAQALLVGAQPIVETSRQLAPVLKEPDPRWKPGVVRRNIRARRVRPRGYAATVIVGVRQFGKRAFQRLQKRAAKKGGLLRAPGRNNPDDPFYWIFSELGAPARGIPARAFLRPALEQRRNDAVNGFARALGPQIQKIAATLVIRKGKK
jgi:HK97 gp10 family phage protein